MKCNRGRRLCKWPRRCNSRLYRLIPFSSASARCLFHLFHPFTPVSDNFVIFVMDCSTILLCIICLQTSHRILIWLPNLVDELLTKKKKIPLGESMVCTTIPHNVIEKEKRILLKCQQRITLASSTKRSCGGSWRKTNLREKKKPSQVWHRLRFEDVSRGLEVLRSSGLQQDRLLPLLTASIRCRIRPHAIRLSGDHQRHINLTLQASQDAGKIQRS